MSAMSMRRATRATRATLRVAQLFSLCIWAFLRQVCAELPPAYQGRFVNPEAMGVQMMKLTGPMTLSNGSTISLTTVTYFKALHSHERPHQFDVRSQTFFLNPYDPEEIQYNAFYFPLYFATPTPLLKELAFQPTVSLVSLQQDTKVPLPRTHLYSASWHHRVLNNTTQEIRWQAQDGGYDAMIPVMTNNPVSSVEMANKTWLFSITAPHYPPDNPTQAPIARTWHERGLLASSTFVPNIDLDKQHALYEAPPTFAAIIKPLCSYIHFNKAVNQAVKQAFFLRQIGFLHYYLYDRGEFEQPLLAHPATGLALDRGWMSVMRFAHPQSGLPMYYESFWTAHVKKMRTLDLDHFFVTSHAALAFWGTNTYLLLVDIDELPELPQGVMMPMLFNRPDGCLADVAYTQLTRRNYLCEYIDSEDERVQFVDSNNMPSYEWIKQYQTCTEKESLATHPRFNKTEDGPDFHGTWPKVLVHADAGAYFHCHDGLVYPEYAGNSLGKVNESCLGMVHLAHLMSPKRDDLDEDVYEPATNWTWPLASFLKQESVASPAEESFSNV